MDHPITMTNNLTREETRLTIVIVNYNVKYYLEQCIHAVKKAIGHFSLVSAQMDDEIASHPAEIIVVDNDSKDGSVAMLKEKFPEILIIENIENKGFAAGNH